MYNQIQIGNTSILTRYPCSCAGVSVVNVDVLSRSETISEKLKIMERLR